MASIVVIVNPTKFQDVNRARRELTGLMKTFGVTEFDWVETTAQETGTAQTEAAVRDGAELVLSWGGDGTVRAVAQGLIGSNTQLGILPGGTGNLVAKNLNLPGTLRGALGVALGGSSMAIDVNEVDIGDGETYLSLLICGMGLDAAVIDSPEELKAAFGPGAYAASGIKNLVGSAKPLSVTMDDEATRRMSARMVLVGNFGQMQMGLNLFDKADATDGELALFVAKLRGVREVLWTGKGVAFGHLFGTRAKGRHRLQLSGKRVKLQTTEPWPREIDGDLIEPGTTMNVTVIPEAIKVRVK